MFVKKDLHDITRNCTKSNKFLKSSFADARFSPDDSDVFFFHTIRW